MGVVISESMWARMGVRGWGAAEGAWFEKLKRRPSQETGAGGGDGAR